MKINIRRWDSKAVVEPIPGSYEDVESYESEELSITTNVMGENAPFRDIVTLHLVSGKVDAVTQCGAIVGVYLSEFSEYKLLRAMGGAR